MLPEKIHLEIVTPERRVLERDVDEVILPGAEGSFGVLPGHAPMLAGLAAGVAVARGGGDDVIMAISAGYAEVEPSRVIVVAETCETADEIDEQRAEEMVKEIEKEVASNPESDPDMLRLRMMKHIARIRASQRRF